MDERTHELINIDLRVATGSKAFDDALKDFYETKILKESEERFRCEICGKMFKSRLFTEKHMHNKHPENIKEIEARVQKGKSYLLTLRRPMSSSTGTI